MASSSSNAVDDWDQITIHRNIVQISDLVALTRAIVAHCGERLDQVAHTPVALFSALWPLSGRLAAVSAAIAAIAPPHYNIGLVEVYALRGPGKVDRHIDGVRGKMLILSIGAPATLCWGARGCASVESGDVYSFDGSLAAGVEHEVTVSEDAAVPAPLADLLPVGLRLTVQLRPMVRIGAASSLLNIASAALDRVSVSAAPAPQHSTATATATAAARGQMMSQQNNSRSRCNFAEIPDRLLSEITRRVATGGSSRRRAATSAAEIKLARVFPFEALVRICARLLPEEVRNLRSCCTLWRDWLSGLALRVPPLRLGATRGSSNDANTEDCAAVVLSFGSAGEVFAGFAGEDQPFFCVSSLFEVGARIGCCMPALLARDDVPKALAFAICGNSVHFDRAAFCAVLRFIYYELLRVAPEEHALLISMPEIPKDAEYRSVRQELTEAVFADLNVPALYVAIADVLPLYAVGEMTGVSLRVNRTFVRARYINCGYAKESYGQISWDEAHAEDDGLRESVERLLSKVILADVDPFDRRDLIVALSGDDFHRVRDVEQSLSGYEKSKVVSFKQKHDPAWIGASLLASLSTFQVRLVLLLIIF